MTAVRVSADADGLDAALSYLRAGLTVAIPTDTVYGLAVVPTLPGATDGLFAIKGRPRHVPIAVLVADADQAWTLADRASLSPASQALAAKYWPGALTLVVPRRPGWRADLGDEGGTVGVRCPDHRWVRDLCRRVGPLATTSANIHGRSTPEDAASVATLFGDHVALVVDGGTCAGPPSTVVDCSTASPCLVRAGRIPAEELGLADPSGGGG